jgi:hypothetical protein
MTTTLGLDSLLAPFLTLNFEREARAYWCLHSLTSRYLPNFFLPDNTIPLQEHLATFRQLLAYHGTHRTRAPHTPHTRTAHTAHNH